MDVEYNLRLAAASQEKDRLLLREKILQESKNRLAHLITTKIRTSFVCPLAVFEELFGELWGFGKPAAECSPEELQERDLWTKARELILDNGNSQIRAIEKELEQYVIEWVRNRYTLRVTRSKHDTPQA